MGKGAPMATRREFREIRGWPENLREFWKQLADTVYGRYRCAPEGAALIAYQKIRTGWVKLPDLVVQRPADGNFPRRAEELNARITWCCASQKGEVN